MDQRPSTLLRIAAPLRSLLQRFAYMGLILAAFGLMLIGKIDAVLVDQVRAEVTNAVAPILSALSRPAATVADTIDNFRSLAEIRQENVKLREENYRLLQWQMAARKLQVENTALQSLLGVAKDRKAKYVTARVIAGSNGAFAKTLILNAGKTLGLRPGQAVLTERGFVGRVSAVSSHSARVLLLTDFNSRVPVVIETTRTRAVMAGGSSRRPRLIHLPQGARVSPSERVVTSGHGGLFPPGLPVGVVASVTDGGIDVQLFADYDRIEFVRVADYGRVETGTLEK